MNNVSYNSRKIEILIDIILGVLGGELLIHYYNKFSEPIYFISVLLFIALVALIVELFFRQRIIRLKITEQSSNEEIIRAIKIISSKKYKNNIEKIRSMLLLADLYIRIGRYSDAKNLIASIEENILENTNSINNSYSFDKYISLLKQRLSENQK